MQELPRLKAWFQSTKRELPWRTQPTPYAVWISEVMLQQTQVNVVVPYFERWMKKYPTVEALAKAPLDDVIKSWEGLGYYSRARNLHAGARYLVENHGGKFPDTREALLKIKGLGDYTVGALLSFAFHQREPAVDGNVIRVLSRYYLIEDDVCKAKTQKHLRELAKALLPEEEPWVFVEALIELGATICAKKAKCTECPLKTSCKAFQQGAVSRLPYKSAKVQIENLFRAVPLIVCQGDLLIRRAGKGEIMSDLHEFPYFETDAKGLSTASLKKEIKEKFHLEVKPLHKLPEENHGFTRYQVKLFPHLFACTERISIQGYQWISFKKLLDLPFSSGHRRILHVLNALNPALIQH